MIMDISKNGRWVAPFKKFGMVRVKGKNMTIIISILSNVW